MSIYLFMKRQYFSVDLANEPFEFFGHKTINKFKDYAYARFNY